MNWITLSRFFTFSWSTIFRKQFLKINSTKTKKKPFTFSFDYSNLFMCFLFELKKINKYEKRWHTLIKCFLFIESYTSIKQFENKKSFCWCISSQIIYYFWTFVTTRFHWCKKCCMSDKLFMLWKTNCLLLSCHSIIMRKSMNY